MGIPKFYRWLSERYPLINQPGGSTVVPVIDNLYLDMNGIIHNATHGNSDDNAKLTEDEMVMRIFNYLDKLVSIAQPQKVLFMAIDGVAPRAKMNQQRSRRFKAAKEAQERQAAAPPAADDARPVFDSNCITPGTPFMMRLGEHLRFFIRRRMEEDPAWAALTVIFSGHEVPGEGEHKIMEHLRWARLARAYPANTRHCMYGLDADLVMLSLVTHEPHFCLMREIVTYGGARPGQPAREVLENPCREHFVFLNIGHVIVLREYLALDCRPEGELPFPYDPERVIDDFVLFCMLVGNDFLPPIPTVDINEGSLDMMIGLYKRLLPELGGYLTYAGALHTQRLEVFMAGLAEVEAATLSQRAQDTEEEEARQARRRGRGAEQPAWASERVQAARGNGGGAPAERRPAQALPRGGSAAVIGVPGRFDALRLDDDEEEEGARVERQTIDGERQATATPVVEAASSAAAEPSPVPAASPPSAEGASWPTDEDVPASPDPAVLEVERRRAPGNELELLMELEGEDDAGPQKPTMMSREARDLFLAGGDSAAALAAWRERYYKDKLGVPCDAAGVFAVTEAYLQGLHWVLEYYYRGVLSWTWYYPFHYAPMASDLVRLEAARLSFARGSPFLPYEQLLAVQPPASKNLLPAAFQSLMTDAASPIKDFYPTEFAVDLEGKRADWEGIVLLPFIDEARLLAAARAVPGSSLTPAERAANSHGPVLVFSRRRADAGGAAPSGGKLERFCKSTLPGHFSDVQACGTVVLERQPPPPLPAGRRGFEPRLLPGTRVGKGAPGGYPALGTLRQAAPRLQRAGVSVFGRASAKDSLILTVAAPPEIPHGEQLAQLLVGRQVWIRWPYLVEGIVDLVHTRVGKYGSEGLQTTYSDGSWAQLVAPHVTELLTKRGLDVKDSPVWLSVRPVVELHRLADGSVKKEFGRDAELVPMQLALLRNPNPDPRFDPELAAQKLLRVQPGSRGVLLAGPYRGCVAEVRAAADPGAAGAASTASVSVRPPPASELSLARTAKSLFLHGAGQPRFFPAYKAARQLGVSPSTLGRMTGSLWLVAGPERADRLDVGLCVRRPGDGLLVPEATRYIAAPADANGSTAPAGPWARPSAADPPRKGGPAPAEGGDERRLKGQWEYSEELVQVMAAYKRRAPWVWQAVEADGRARELKAVDAAPGATPDERVAAARELYDWLRAQPLAKRPLVKLGAAVVRAEGVRLFQATFAAAAPGPALELAGVPLHALVPPLKPGAIVVYQRTGGPFSLGDRVVSLRDGRAPPFGARGTVTAVLDGGGTVEVVFDAPFPGGTDLQGRCVGTVGALLPATELLNATPSAPSAPSATNNAVAGPRRGKATAAAPKGKAVAVPSLAVVDDLRTKPAQPGPTIPQLSVPSVSVAVATGEHAGKKARASAKNSMPRAPDSPSDRGFAAGRGRGAVAAPVAPGSLTPVAPGQSPSAPPASASEPASQDAPRPADGASAAPDNSLQKLFATIRSSPAPKTRPAAPAERPEASPSAGKLLAMLQTASGTASRAGQPALAAGVVAGDGPPVSLAAPRAAGGAPPALAATPPAPPPPMPSASLLGPAATGPAANGMDASAFWEMLNKNPK